MTAGATPAPGSDHEISRQHDAHGAGPTGPAPTIDCSQALDTDNGSSDDPEPEDLRASCDPLPADPDAEAALIGAALINRAAAVVVAGVALEDYFVQRNANIAGAIRDVIAEAETPDPVLVHDALRAAGHHHIGLADLHELFATTPSVSSARRYAAIVRRHARHRRVVHLAHELGSAAMAGSGDEVRRIVEQLVELTDDEEPGQ